MIKDKEDFDDLWTLSGLQNSIIYHSNISFEYDPDSDLIIFDEADEYIYGNPQAFTTFLSKSFCVCLTATSGGKNEEALEMSILKHIGLKIFDDILSSPE